MPHHSPQRLYGLAAAIALIALVRAAPAAAQIGAANVGGIVVDTSGAALPGVTITITNTANGFGQTFVTGERGNVRAVALQPAPYDIRAELTGFAPITRRIVLTVDTDATVDFQLGLATVTENVTVVGESPLVEVTKSQPSSVVTSE